MTAIEENAFYRCQNIREITLPLSLRQIGDYAFDNCNNLNRVYFEGTENDWNTYVVVGDGNGALQSWSLNYLNAPMLPATGACGTDAHYVLDADGLLTISGTGMIESLGDIPVEAVRKMVVEEGITGMSGGDFFRLTEI